MKTSAPKSRPLRNASLGPALVRKSRNNRAARPALKKSRTGIKGLDEVTAGGLPARRATLVCGVPGCGKSLLGMEFHYVAVERAEVREAGEFDLEGLFIRLRDAIDAVGAKHLVLATVEALFCGFANKGILQLEHVLAYKQQREQDTQRDRQAMARSRKAAAGSSGDVAAD